MSEEIEEALSDYLEEFGDRLKQFAIPYRGAAKKLCGKVNKDYHAYYNCAHPGQPNKFSPEEIARLIWEMGPKSIPFLEFLRSEGACRGDDTPSSTPAESLISIMAELGEVAHDLNEAGADGIFTPNEKKSLRKQLTDVIQKASEMQRVIDSQ